MTPYEPPSNAETVLQRNSIRNPVTTALYVIGGYCLISSLFALVFGTFMAGPRVAVLALAQLFFGLSAIWLARRTFDRLARRLTILWGTSLAGTIIFGLLLADSTKTTADMVRVGAIVAVILLVPIVAFLKSPTDSVTA